MKKVLALVLVAVVAVCLFTACTAPQGAAEEGADVKLEGKVWAYDDLVALTFGATDEELEDLCWRFGVEDVSGLMNAMKSDAFFSTTFKNMWVKFDEDGTAEFVRNGAPETYYWEYEEGSTVSGYLAASKDFFGNTEKSMYFTLSEDGDVLSLNTPEPYDGDFQYTFTFNLTPEG